MPMERGGDQDNFDAFLRCWPLRNNRRAISNGMLEARMMAVEIHNVSGS